MNMANIFKIHSFILDSVTYLNLILIDLLAVSRGIFCTLAPSVIGLYNIIGFKLLT